jgi:hypothetical protein
MENTIEQAGQHTTQYDDELQRIEHYQRHPQMMPFIGADYGKFGPKILLIAESHYLHKDSTIHLEAQKWYDCQENQLAGHEQFSTCTRRCLTKKGPTWKIKAYSIFRNLEASLIEAGYPIADNTLRYVAFMNGFQRPAVSRLSIKASSVDLKYSLPTIRAVLDVIKPDHVVFVSRKAYRAFGHQLDVQAFSAPHPASPWWNRSSKQGTGKDQFVKLIKSFQ